MRLAMSEPMTPPERTSSVLGGLITDAKDLVVAHGERMKLEVRDELGGLKDWIKLVGIAVAAVAVAGILAGHAIALGVAAATGLPVWAGYAIVAVIATTAGYLVFKRRPPSHAIDLVPERSLRAAKRDAEMVADVVKS
jgi:hypothetical protein